MLKLDDGLIEELYEKYDHFGDFIVDISIDDVEEIYNHDILKDIEKHDDIFNVLLTKITGMNDNIYCNHSFNEDLLEFILKMINLLQAEMELELDDEKSFDLNYEKLEILLKEIIKKRS